MNKQNSCLKWQIFSPSPPHQLKNLLTRLSWLKYRIFYLVLEPNSETYFMYIKNPTKYKLGLYKWAIKCFNLKDFYL